MPRGRKMSEGWVPVTHGITSSYNRGCRCRECSAANATRRGRVTRAGVEAQKRRYAERFEVDGHMVHPDPRPGHGALSSYTAYGCHCDACREAWTAYYYDKRHRPKVKPKPADLTEVVELDSVFEF